MFCRQCGTQVNDNDKFCSKCGFNLNSTINNQESEIADIEKDFSALENKIDSITDKSFGEKEYLRKKWVTVILFLIPYTSLFGIHHFYNKRHLRGILYISLELLMLILVDSHIFKPGFLISILIFIIIFYFFVTDLNWIIKLPKIYFVKRKYSLKVVSFTSLIPIFLFILQNSIILGGTEGVSSIQKNQLNNYSQELIDRMGLKAEQEQISNIFKDIGISLNDIASINYDEILDGGFSWEESNYEFTDATEKGYRIKLNSGEQLIAYSENGNLLGIKIVDGEYMYKGGKLLYTIDKAKQLLDEKYKKLEEENKKIKIGETKSMIGKEIVINSVEFKKEVHPPKKSSYYNYYKADDGQVYIHILASVKNLGKQAIYCDEVIGIKADYNDGYTYQAFSTVEDDTLGFTYSNIKTIDPLQTKNIHYLISVPEEVQNNKDVPLILKFSTGLEEYELTIR